MLTGYGATRRVLFGTLGAFYGLEQLLPMEAVLS